MTQLARTQVRYPTRTLAAVALLASLAGGLAGTGLQALSHAPAADAPGSATRDLVVLKAAQEWEARYRQMYPNSR
jgi:hypothetical protein